MTGQPAADALQQALASARAASLRRSEAVCGTCGHRRARHRLSDDACPADAIGCRFQPGRRFVEREDDDGE